MRRSCVATSLSTENLEEIAVLTKRSLSGISLEKSLRPDILVQLLDRAQHRELK